MSPEHDDYRENQLAALRRYVSDLDIRRQQHPEEAQPSERRRTIWPWLLVTLLLMAVSLAGGIALGAGGDAGQRRTSGFASATASSVAALPTASPECAEAVERANESISHAVRVSAALREHTEVMNRLLNGKIDASAAVRAGTPSLITGSAESARFDVALADYKKVVDRCKLRTP
ncbi:MAG: hypothetical protein K0S88_2333 [Actinomycetia bacterium]|jgi:hypothetical protein|nr:hypothetical protein [Actinomycetes bacterium]